MNSFRIAPLAPLATCPLGFIPRMGTLALKDEREPIISGENLMN